MSLLVTPTAGIAETFKESFECHFGRGLVNRPTPSHLVFSVDEFGRSALIHEVDIPDINTHSGPGRVKRDSIRRLSIGWVGENYVYSASGRSIASNESVIDAIDRLCCTIRVKARVPLTPDGFMLRPLFS
ncbi:hypothetical protein, partial [uncultured Ruegeria sp.]|uniref:hypothetical protein n=1 Tax=uncultured Ruegeria sp. TaxID=259304 RepID=UPI002627ADD6